MKTNFLNSRQMDRTMTDTGWIDEPNDEEPSPTSEFKYFVVVMMSCLTILMYILGAGVHNTWNIFHWNTTVAIQYIAIIGVMWLIFFLFKHRL